MLPNGGIFHKRSNMYAKFKKWTTVRTNVDIETGEILPHKIDKYQWRYLKQEITNDYKTSNEYNIQKITSFYKRHEQQTLF